MEKEILPGAEKVLNDFLDEHCAGPPLPNTYIMDDFDGHRCKVLGKYRLKKTLGQGSFAKVKLGRHVHCNELVAVKIIKKDHVMRDEIELRALVRESRLLRRLDHPHVIKLYEVLHTQDKIYLILEYASGGELFDLLIARRRLEENAVRGFMRQIISALDHVHEHKMAHRDLKPENLLLDENFDIKLIDFGLSNEFNEGELLQTACGSPAYGMLVAQESPCIGIAAPEVVSGRHYDGRMSDIWSCGVVMYTLLVGHRPFRASNIHRLYKAIKSGQYEVPRDMSAGMFFEMNDFEQERLGARSLLDGMLQVNSAHRATTKQIAGHAWLNEGFDTPPLVHQLQQPIDEEVVSLLMTAGHTRDEILAVVHGSHPTPLNTLYRLLRDRHRRGIDLDDVRLPSVTRRKTSIPHSEGSADEKDTPSMGILSTSPPTRSSPGKGRRMHRRTMSEDRTSIPSVITTPERLTRRRTPSTGARPPIVRGRSSDHVSRPTVSITKPVVAEEEGRRHSLAPPSSDYVIVKKEDDEELKKKESPASRRLSAGSPPSMLRRFSLGAAALMQKITGPKVRTIQVTKGQSSDTTSTKEPDVVLEALRMALIGMGVECKANRNRRFSWYCTWKNPESPGEIIIFEAEVVELKQTHFRALTFNRLKGDTDAYTELCRLIAINTKL